MRVCVGDTPRDSPIDDDPLAVILVVDISATRRHRVSLVLHANFMIVPSNVIGVELVDSEILGVAEVLVAGGHCSCQHFEVSRGRGCGVGGNEA